MSSSLTFSEFESLNSEVDVAQVDAAQVDVAEVDAAQVDVAEVDATQVGVPKAGIAPVSLCVGYGLCVFNPVYILPI